ncbi:DUF2457 domain-containing protein [Natronorubrum sulfidifaciens]|uniref:DUF2457 domain-containing protein n=1 Tax=Natronorubrum sulfidifaciens TaxID=388259 RepID=UPI0013759353|nr:DUF2457 domain-containing protein [Natronorubrum sulfidifaciens]
MPASVAFQITYYIYFQFLSGGMVDWKTMREAFAQAASWMAGGLFGGLVFALFSLSIDVISPEFLTIFLLISGLAIYVSYGVVQLRPDKGQDMVEIKEELRQVRAEMVDDEPNDLEEIKEELRQIQAEVVDDEPNDLEEKEGVDDEPNDLEEKEGVDDEPNDLEEKEGVDESETDREVDMDEEIELETQ